MPASANTSASQASHALASAALDTRPASGKTHFGVVPFRRDATGAIVPGLAVEVPNGDIAWRRARADAFDHDNVGAVALTGSDLADTGKVRQGVLIAFFGEVALDTLVDRESPKQQ